MPSSPETKKQIDVDLNIRVYKLYLRIKEEGGDLKNAPSQIADILGIEVGHHERRSMRDKITAAIKWGMKIFPNGKIEIDSGDFSDRTRNPRVDYIQDLKRKPKQPTLNPRKDHLQSLAKIAEANPKLTPFQVLAKKKANRKRFKP